MKELQPRPKYTASKLKDRSSFMVTTSTPPNAKTIWKIATAKEEAATSSECSYSKSRGKKTAELESGVKLKKSTGRGWLWGMMQMWQIWMHPIWHLLCISFSAHIIWATAEWELGVQQVTHNDPYCLMPGELVPKPQVIELFEELARPTFIHNKVHIYSLSSTRVYSLCIFTNEKRKWSVKWN